MSTYNTHHLPMNLVIILHKAFIKDSIKVSKGEEDVGPTNCARSTSSSTSDGV